MSTLPNLGGQNLGGGPFNGFSPVQTINNYKTGEDALTRRVLRSAWNSRSIAGPINGYGRVITPFRAVNNMGDFLGRVNYVCGGPAMINASRPGYRRLIRPPQQSCDLTGVGGSSCNPKFVADSSDYVRFKRQSAVNRNYNDMKNGGYNNSAYVAIMAIRR